MRLELGTFEVRDAHFGSSTVIERGVLTVNKEELRRQILEDAAFSDAEVHIARPGEGTRINGVREVMEPRWKVEGPGQVFPGFVGPPVTVGEGKTNRLAGTALIAVSERLPAEGSSPLGHALIDMVGPGAECCPFGKTINVVLHLKPNTEAFPDLLEEPKFRDPLGGSAHVVAYNRSVTKCAVKVAAYLGRATEGLKPDGVEVFQLGPCDPSLPKVAVLHEENVVTIYGARTLRGPLWTGALMHPNESFDGAVVIRNGATYLEQNSDVLLGLCRLHGKEVNFVGYVIFGGETPSLEEKERVSSAASSLVRLLGTQGVVFQGISGSNYQVDTMWTLKKLEQAGIKTSLIISESGVGPEDPGFTFCEPEAIAIVNAGSGNRPIKLPAIKKVIGGETLVISDKEWDARGELNLSVSSIHSAVNVISMNHLTTRLY
ncbi:MAG: hypothetical protein HY676_06340 [Chloroflexi bacterium]|nr:hypothetical protein [Chloroflexota bacterium]